MAPGHRRSPSSAPLRTSLCPSTALPTKTDTCQCLQVAARQGSCSAPDRASSRLLLQLCGQLCLGPSRHCQDSIVESLSSGAGASSWIRTCELGCQVPPWPNGQGVGPLIRRLRAQVPQGVIFVAPGCCEYCRLLARGHCAVQAWAAWGELQRRMDVRMFCGWSCVPWPAHSTQHLHRHARCRSGHRPMCQLAVPAARVDDSWTADSAADVQHQMPPSPASLLHVQL